MGLFGRGMEDPRSEEMAEMIAGTAAGDVRAETRLYGRLWPILFGYCFDRLGDAMDAEEAAQSSIAEIMERANQIRFPQRPWRYCRLVARKHCDRRIRKAVIHTTDLTDAADEVRQDPLSQFLANTDRQRALGALRSLNERLRTVLVLYYLNDHRITEIASFLGITTGAVKKRLVDGRKRLRRILSMVEGTMRDFRDLSRLSDRAIQRLLREIPEETLAGVIRGLIPEIRALIERNVSQRVLDRLKNASPDAGATEEAVVLFWRTLDALIDAGEVAPGARSDSKGSEAVVDAIAKGRGERDRAEWLRICLNELSVKARKHGLFALRHDAVRAGDPLLAAGLRALVDGTPPRQIAERLDTVSEGAEKGIVTEAILAIQEGRAL